MKKHKQLLFGLIFALAIVSVFPISRAVSASGFDAGRIIDDSVFTDTTSMSVNEIQTFLNNKNSVCLRNYQTSEPLGNNNYGGNVSAAHAIWKAGQLYGINPQVLIVTLQKEQGLVTRSDCPTWRYNAAMGFGCPDTAPCDAQWYGLSKQLYQGARHLKGFYDQSAGWYIPYRPGVRYIQWHPNSGCGGTNVNIQNRATASLYSYTPYQPNTAALNAGFGTGDGCSSYGNRNFWLYFNAWFDSSLGSYLVRSPENSTVYLISSDSKYPIGSMDIVGALYPLGDIQFVSQQYLDSKTTGNSVGRLLRSSDGTIYFFDAGIKLSFSSCAMVAHYGYTCGDYVSLSDSQLQKLTTGPSMTQFFGTPGGKLFYINNGLKNEAFDVQSLQENGLSPIANTLNESAINNLAYGAPVIRSNVIARSRSTGSLCLYYQASCHSVTAELVSETSLDSLPIKYLDQSSISTLSSAGEFTGFIKNSSSTLHYVIDRNGKAEINAPATWTNNFTIVPDNFLSLFPTSTQPINNLLIKSNSGASVYLVTGQAKRPIAGWNALVRLGINPLTINTLSNTTISGIPNGAVLLGSGSLVKTSDNATVYMIDGLNNKVPLSSFTITAELGIPNNISTFSQTMLDAYSSTPSVLSTKVSCDSKNYVGTLGRLHEVDNATAPHYNFTYQTLDPMTCTSLTKDSEKLGQFIHVPDGTIYIVENGTKRPFSAWSQYVEAGGNSTNTISVSNFFASQIAN